MILGPTVFVVDDDPTLRDSLRWLLHSMKLNVRTFASGREFLAACDPLQPGCLLLDVRMPEISGLQLQEMLVSHGLQLPVIIITGHGNVAMAVRAMKAGAYDFLEKPFNDQTLLERVQQCIALDARRRREAAEHRRIDDRLRTLTTREREVLGEVVSGRANKQIAADLGISVKTVEAHRGHIMEKMQLHSVAELTAAYVARCGEALPVNRVKPLGTSATASMY
jgi:FixJ family two-component response regulator